MLIMPELVGKMVMIKLGNGFMIMAILIGEIAMSRGVKMAQVEDDFEALSDDDVGRIVEGTGNLLVDMINRENAERQILENAGLSDASHAEQSTYLDNYNDEQSAALLEMGVPDDQIDDCLYGKDAPMMNDDADDDQNDQW
jgi:hypothetical protein